MNKSFEYSDSNECSTHIATDTGESDKYMPTGDSSAQSHFSDKIVADTELVGMEQEQVQSLQLPKIKTVSGYIREHCAEHIISSIQKKILNGNLGVRHDRRILYNRQMPNGTIRVHLHPRSGQITKMHFRRVGYNMVYARITIQIVLDVQLMPSRIIEETSCLYRGDVWLDMENDAIAADHGNYRLYHNEKDMDGVPLDDYLIPILDRSGIDEEAENIIAQICSKGLLSPEWLQPSLFASALGLKIVELPLYKRTKTKSILFFDEGNVLAENENKQPYSVRIDKNTIVVNNRHGFAYKDAICHECFHFVEHRLFYQLQRVYSNEAEKLLQQNDVRLRDEDPVPLRWIEWQANYGGQCLQMPRTLVLRRIKEELAKQKAATGHMGFTLQAIGRKLAQEFTVPNFRMRNRMIQLGYGEAKGALNYVNGGYITPFAFALNTCWGGRTFVVSMRDVIREYGRNDVFRDLIDTGSYIYVDGHVCVNDPEYIVNTQSKLRMTEWANAHVDECCLRFAIVYVRDTQTRYIYGQLNSDEEYNERSLSLSLAHSGQSVMESAKTVSRLLMSLPGDFSGTLCAHMDRCGVTIEKLAERTGLSVRTINRLRNEEKQNYSINQVVLLSLALHLPPEFSMDMIEKAGLRLRKKPEDLIYGVVLRTMYMESLETIRNALRECGAPDLIIKE